MKDGDNVVFFKHKKFLDGRGWLANINPRDFIDKHAEPFVHSFISYSLKNTLRGFHFQEPPYEQAKIVHVIAGSILDVSFSLDSEENRPICVASVLGDGTEFDTVFLGARMAHAFLVLSDSATLLYLNSSEYCEKYAKSINPIDPDIGFDWGVARESLILSERDAQAISWSDYLTWI